MWTCKEKGFHGSARLCTFLLEEASCMRQDVTGGCCISAGPQEGEGTQAPGGRA